MSSRVLCTSDARRLAKAGGGVVRRVGIRNAGRLKLHHAPLAACLALASAACMVTAWAQPAAPHIGYVYPAGGQQGTVFRATVGGQYLRGADDVYVSGEGVRAAVKEYIRPLNDQELGQVARFLRQMVKKRWSLQTIRAAGQPGAKPELPDHPWLRDLDLKSPRELAQLRAKLFNRKKQPNAQIAEQVEIEVTVDPTAPPGDRELRLATPTGLSNPVRFQVGVLPEVRDEDCALLRGTDTPAVALPVVLNGQIMPGEVDRFRLQARQGQKLVMRAQARRLVPYLADAVPGWFQATLALFDPWGREVAYADDFRFDPDPVLFFEVPADGVYELEIHDAIYRGREDFVYRIAVGELPFVTDVFPLGGQEGVPTTATITGWNLPTTELALDTRPGPEAIRRICLDADKGLCNQVTYAVDTLPESMELEPNDTATSAQAVAIPCTINGRIARPGDVDVFAFTGRAGEDVVAEVYARRLGSPLDGALKLLDEAGQVLASNDDNPDPEMGLITHHADPCLRITLPHDGTYQLRLLEVQQHGGDAYAYRLQLRPPRPDFAVRLTPSSINLVGRRPALVTAHAVRKDGFAGDIELVLKDAPGGLTLAGGRIPAGQDSVQMTISPPRDATQQIFALQLEARAEIGGVPVSRPVVPAEDMMQAFIYQHLVPQQELLVAVAGPRPVPAVWRPRVAGVQVATPTPIQIPLGGMAQVEVRGPQVLPGPVQSALQMVQFSLVQPPRGVSLHSSAVTPAGVTLTVKADANCAQLGYAGNLIVEASVQRQVRKPDGTPTGRTRRVSLGVLPAIPFQIVRAAP